MPRPDDGEFEHEQYGHFNAVPHAQVELTSGEWHEVVKQVLRYSLGPPIAWHYDGGILFLWGEQLDETLLRRLADHCNDSEQDLAGGGHYDAARNAENAASAVLRAEVHPAGERMIT